MENASKALIIAGAILLSILIIAIGMYIYTSSHNSISEAGSQISEQEKTSFNQQWNAFEGAQGGNNVKALLQKVIANCNTNAEEEQRLVDVYCTRAKESEKNGGNYHYFYDITINNAKKTDSDPNLDMGAIPALTKLRNNIEARHTYYVSLEYSSNTALVSSIIIAYEQTDPTPETGNNGRCGIFMK